MAKINWNRVVCSVIVRDNWFDPYEGKPDIDVRVTGTSNKAVKHALAQQVEAGVEPVYTDRGHLTGIFTGSVPAGVRVKCKPGTWDEA